MVHLNEDYTIGVHTAKSWYDPVEAIEMLFPPGGKPVPVAHELTVVWLNSDTCVPSFFSPNAFRANLLDRRERLRFTLPGA